VYNNLSCDYNSFNFSSAELQAINPKASPLIDFISPDLRAYKNRGKLLVTQGLADPYNTATWPVQYFEQIRAFLSSNGVVAGNASDFNRLFMIPGYGHCGPAVAFPQVPGTVDELGVLTSWVEDGNAPVEMQSTGPADGANRTRKLCAWRRVAKYVVKNPDNWEPFQCAE
jgi:feruloyl esterase